LQPREKMIKKSGCIKDRAMVVVGSVARANIEYEVICSRIEGVFNGGGRSTVMSAEDEFAFN
jgi:hypothetical protein